ncbi:MAG: hypothetical protein ACK55Z_21065, partial [bacterium]
YYTASFDPSNYLRAAFKIKPDPLDPISFKHRQHNRPIERGSSSIPIRTDELCRSKSTYLMPY